MAKIVPAMQLAAHAKSNTLFGGLYGVNSNFFSAMGYFYFVYLWGYAARAVTSATTVSPRHLPQRGVQSLQKPPLPYHTHSPLTNDEHI